MAATHAPTRLLVALLLLAAALPSQWIGLPGCGGSRCWGDLTPTLAGEGGAIGRPARASLLLAPPQATAFIFLGTGYQTLPYGGGAFCPLPTQVFALATGGSSVLPGSGGATLPLEVPAEPTLVGLRLYLQAVLLDFQHEPAICLSNGLELTLQRLTGLAETFQDKAMLDPDVSGSGWGGGKLVPARLGGTGVLGTFDPDMFVGLAPKNGVLTVPTDGVKVKAGRTLTGEEIAVTDGVFEFERLHVPQGLVLAFQGTNAAKLFVRGSALVEGEIRVNGSAAPSHDGGSMSAGLGGQGNCGGAPGGAGAARGAGGRDGGGLAFPAGSPRHNSAAAAAAAGKGSPAFPAGSITYNGYDGWVCAQVAAGGAGGSNAGQGGKGFGELTGSYQPSFWATDVPPDNLPGSPFPYLPKLPGVGGDLQFLAGGAGGGGGGSTPLGSMKGYTIDWHTGQGGGGGGGMLLLRAGSEIVLAQTGLLEASGGASPDPQPYKRAMPGGGGAGGNILMQAAGKFSCQGAVRAPGGRGGVYGEIASYNWGSRSTGGEGGGGFLRAEAPVAPTLAQLAGFVPAATADNTGILEDSDPASGYRSRFYPTRWPTPAFTHFVVEAVENGQPVTYSDDSRLGRTPCFAGTRTPVVLFLQGAKLDAQGKPIAGTETRWLPEAGALNDPANWVGGPPTAVRWILLFDRAALPAPAAVEVRKVAVFFAS